MPYLDDFNLIHQSGSDLHNRLQVAFEAKAKRVAEEVSPDPGHLALAGFVANNARAAIAMFVDYAVVAGMDNATTDVQIDTGLDSEWTTMSLLYANRPT